MTTIRSMKVVVCRLVVGVLRDRGYSVHEIAHGSGLAVPDLLRLVEFGSIDKIDAEKLVVFGMAKIDETRATRRRPAMARDRLGNLHERRPVTLATGW